MLKRNTSSDEIFFYVPKSNINVKNSINGQNEELTLNYNKFSPILGQTGSSTFDYLNYINKNDLFFPKIKDPFLTNNLRNKKVSKNIERQEILSHKIINPINKLRLSNSCELYPKLTKTFMNDKNCLRAINNKELIFEDNLNKNDIIYKIDNDLPLSKFNNFYIKKSLSNDKTNFPNRLSKSNETNNNYKNYEKGMSKYYINFLYNKIFPKIFIEHNVKYNVVDNKLNIYYAENERQFNENLIKRNNYYRLRGKPIKKMYINKRYIADKLKDVKRKIGFLKGITDYSFPSIILQKVKSKNKLYQMNKKKKGKYFLPYEEIEREVNEINSNKAKILSDSIKIDNSKNSYNINNQ